MSLVTRVRERLRQSPIYYGWYIVGAGAISNLLTVGITVWGFGLFIEQFRTEFGWSVKAIALGYSLRSLETGVLSPVTGYLVDRLGPRRSSVIGAVLMAASFFVFARVDSLPMYYAGSAIMALGQSIGGISSFTRAIMVWFYTKRGQAMGVMFMGNAVGYFTPIVMASLMAAAGWRETLVISGIIFLVAGVPLALLVRDRPEDMGFLPDGLPLPEGALPGKGAATQRRSSRPASESGMEVKEVLRVPAFYLMLMTGAVEGLAHGPWSTFNFPHLQTAGFSMKEAGYIVAGYGLCQIPLRYGIGVLADRVGRRRMYTYHYLVWAMGQLCFAFVSPARLWLVPVYWVVQGVAHAANIAGRDSLVADYFGTKRFATIRGLRQSMLLPISILSPLMVGAMFDRWGNYQMAFTLLAMAGATGAIWLSLIRRPLWHQLPEQESQVPTPTL